MNGRWQILCALDAAKAAVPFQRRLREAKDRVLGYRREPDKDAHTIRGGLMFIEWFGQNLCGATVVEIGSGWQPMVPILLSLAGARVCMADLHRLMRPATFRAALEAIRENRSEIASRLGISFDAIDHAARECSDMKERMRELRLIYLAPCDCRRLPFPDCSVDIVTSRTVLEHVPPPVVAAIFHEARRILRPDGLMLHDIDHSDHWSHRDRRLSAVNFLQYPDWLFRLTCANPQNYQNRLRHSQYVGMLGNAGFLLKRQQCDVNSACVTVLSKMRIARRFRSFDPEDLATTCSVLLAEPQPASMKP